ncbi:hypothetical protein AVEN_146344-1, partial [Araneus ventricosus]
PEHGSVSPAYYVPSADSGTQTFDEDFMLLEPSREACTQITDNDFKFLKEIFECHTHENGTKKGCFPPRKNIAGVQPGFHRKSELSFCVSSTNEDFYNLSYDKCNSATIETLLEAIDVNNGHILVKNTQSTIIIINTLLTVCLEARELRNT